MIRFRRSAGVFTVVGDGERPVTKSKAGLYLTVSQRTLTRGNVPKAASTGMPLAQSTPAEKTPLTGEYTLFCEIARGGMRQDLTRPARAPQKCDKKEFPIKQSRETANVLALGASIALTSACAKSPQPGHVR